ncbi:MAG: bifunctional phosphoribosylaminoimidazolecarboxamide formyltransferase/IMP cyclohydrolase [Acidobacteriota bacterium]
MSRIARALVSVSDKAGLVDFCKVLKIQGIQIVSTGGTAAVLEASGVPVTEISELTGFPEILDGRVKTLHPSVHGGLLGRRELETHRAQMEQHGIAPIDLLVVNLYPFRETVARGADLEQAVENIDIGGPAMMRSAAKNFRDVAVVVDPADYQEIARQISATGEISEATRFGLARKVFAHTAAYDAAISAYLDGLATGRPGDRFPAELALRWRRKALLRYGENPHQQAALYQDPESGWGVAAALQLHGKELSFNNYLDLDAAWSLAAEFEEPAAVLIKHLNPCGAAVGKDSLQAYLRALETDPVSAFGSILGFNRAIDRPLADELSKLFVEAIIAPAYHPEALEKLKEKKNLRLMQLSWDARPGSRDMTDYKRIGGGLLAQDRDADFVRREDLKVVTSRAPSDEEWNDLLFAWKVAKHVKSNAIVFCRSGATLGIGAGQMSRVDAVRFGAQKARASLAGSCVASDAFFPFRDGLDETARAGAAAVIQPGGSVRDQEVIEAANEHGLAMVLTGTRHFKH